MTVAQRAVDIEEIYGGISRMRSERTRAIGLYPPPPWAVEALCRRMSFLRSTRSRKFELAEELTIEEELSPCETLIYKHMGDRSGIGARPEIVRDIVESGQSAAITIAVTLLTSPTLKPLDDTVFALRGWPLDAVRAQRVQAQGKHPRRASRQQPRKWD